LHNLCVFVVVFAVLMYINQTHRDCDIKVEGERGRETMIDREIEMDNHANRCWAHVNSITN